MDLFIGRFQPFTVAHQKVVEQMKDPVIVVVGGKKSSLDKMQNPLSVEDRIQMIRKCIPENSHVIGSDHGYIPTIISYLEYHQISINRVFAGDDRLEEYQYQLQRDPQGHIEEFVEIPRDGISATQVRDLLRAGLIEQAKEILPVQLHEDIEYMTKKIQEEPTNAAAGVATSPKPLQMHKRKKVKSFRDFVKDQESEESEGGEE